MLNKFKKTSKYLLYILWTNTIFGLIYFFVFIWLVKYSLLFAYLGCLLLIIIGLLLDMYIKEFITLESFVKLNEKEQKQSKKFIFLILDSFVSFKTVLFVFYFFILIISQIINIAPSFAGEILKNFILANNSGIVLIIAFDRIVSQFSKDRKDTEEKSEKLNAYLYKSQDEKIN